jgi:Spy/CpxP family protein refolding chaperone
MWKNTARTLIVFSLFSLSLIAVFLLSSPTPTSGAALLSPTTTANLCLNNTRSEAECKDCCDSLDADGTARKACRDACPTHDYAQNTSFITVEAPSILGPGGDYAMCSAAGTEQTCKACCDGSPDLQSGDRRFCRDACAASSGGNPPPQPGGNNPTPKPAEAQPSSHEMTIEQAISDEAQRNTIAFDALAFLTGSLGADSFFPPGKVADFWGFQYLRDNDPSQMGHNTDFLTRASLNMLYILTPGQRAELAALAAGQVDSINEYAYRRFTLMDAFRRLLEGDLPAGSTGLDQAAVVAYSADLYRLDGEISYDRAQLMGTILNALTSDQRAYLDAMVGQGMLKWPDVPEPDDLRGLDRDVKIAVMTYAGDMYSWYAGSVEADVYFCPERQGTYFGSFYLKDAPAMGNPDYTISTTLTGDMGRTFLETLTPSQAELVTKLVDLQRPSLLDIVETRRNIATLLRVFRVGETADRATVLNLMEHYGELDGTIVYQLATNFALVNQSLTPEQTAQLMAMRTQMLGEMVTPTGAYLYSQPIAMPEIPNTDFLFAAAP